jgi:hypothetical protein
MGRGSVRNGYTEQSLFRLFHAYFDHNGQSDPAKQLVHQGLANVTATKRLTFSMFVATLVLASACPIAPAKTRPVVTVGLASLEVPIGRFSFPLLFVGVNSSRVLPIERRVGRSWKRIGTIPKKFPAPIGKAGPSGFLSGITFQAELTTQKEGEELRIGVGVLSTPFILRVSSAATPPPQDLFGKYGCASWIKDSINFAGSSVYSGVTNEKVIDISPEGLPPEFCDSLQSNTAYFVSNDPNFRALTIWQPAIVYTTRYLG